MSNYILIIYVYIYNYYIIYSDSNNVNGYAMHIIMHTDSIIKYPNRSNVLLLSYSSHFMFYNLFN